MLVQLYYFGNWIRRVQFLRLLLPLVIGILCQWYLNCAMSVSLTAAIVSLALLFGFQLLSAKEKFRWYNLTGVLIHILLWAVGCLLILFADERKQQSWYGHGLAQGQFLRVAIAESPIEKTNSYKADAVVLNIHDSLGRLVRNASGKVTLYIAKSANAAALRYGDVLTISSRLQPIKNAGNPGGFNYERYAQFQGVFHTAYLRDSDYVAGGKAHTSMIRSAIFSTREYIVQTLRHYVGDNDYITAVAEALLIGYKQDLDKDLVQAYSNAGVVHIIAISGLHLGLIYFLLVWLVDRLPLVRRSKLIKAIIILGCLWGFSLLTGASASVLRSAVMFTFIVLGKYFFRQANMYNTLAASAFVLLCFDPYLLWDVGFQLSYLAVIGIVWLQKPIEGLWVIPLYKRPKGNELFLKPVNTVLFAGNWLLRHLWKMSTITLAAQLATTPITIYYFHQFPNLFLFANIIAVPLSTIILYLEILLIAVSPIGFVAGFVGDICYWFIDILNKVILWFDSISFSRIDDIYANVPTTIVLYMALALLAFALIYNHKKVLLAGLAAALLHVVMLFYFSLGIASQRKLVVYNTAKLQAMDLVVKNKYKFIGDSILTADAAPRNFYLRPARINFQANNLADSVNEILISGNYLQWFDQKIMLIDTAMYFPAVEERQPIDVVVVSRNAKVKMHYLVNAIEPGVVVFDASNSRWKIEQWKSECTMLNLRHYSVIDSGAFVYNIPSPPSQ